MAAAAGWRPVAFVGGWVLASAVGWAAGLVLGQLLAPLVVQLRLPLSFDSDLASSYLILITLGLTLGGMQSMALRRRLPGVSGWLVATGAGFLLGLGVLAAANSSPMTFLSTQLWNNAALLMALGAAIGVCQAWRMRRLVRKAGWWILASAAGFLFFLWGILDPSRDPLEFTLRSTASGTLGAIVTGVSLYLLARPGRSRAEIASPLAARRPEGEAHAA